MGDTGSARVPALVQVASIASCALLGASLATGQAGTAALSAKALAAKAGDYVRAYQEQFAFLLADETSTQRVIASRDPRSDVLATRVTRGEMFLTYLQSDRQWTVVHDVAEVDGSMVPDREDLPALLERDSVTSVARRVFERNARFNIGRVLRNFNDPMLALLALSPAHRARFSVSLGSSDRRDPSLATLTFRERERPTLVKDVSGRAVYARGQMTIEATTGVVRRTSITFTHEGILAELATVFELDARVGVWVPSVFTEHYASTRDGRDESTICESVYTNYRRFEVTGRIR